MNPQQASVTENDVKNSPDLITEGNLSSVINFFTDYANQKSGDASSNETVEVACPDHTSKSLSENVDEGSVNASSSSAVDEASQDHASKAVGDNVDEKSVNAPSSIAAEVSQDHISKPLNVNEEGVDASSNHAAHEASQNQDSVSLDDLETNKIIEDPSNDADDEASLECVSASCNDNESNMSVDTLQNDLNIQVSNQSHETGIGMEEEIVDATPNIAVVMVQSLRADYVPEAFNENEVDKTTELISDNSISEASQDQNSSTPSCSNGEESVVLSNEAVDAAPQNNVSKTFNNDEEISAEVSHDITVNTASQPNESTLINSGEDQVILDIAKEISQAQVSESSDDDFLKTIEDVVEEAFDDEDEELKIIDVPVKNILPECVTLSSDEDDDFVKDIGEAVSEAFLDNDSPSNEKSTDASVAAENRGADVSPHQIEFEMSIEVDGNNKVKVERASPEPRPAMLPVPAKKATELPPEKNYFRSNHKGLHAFSIIVSSFDSTDPKKCIVYAGSENKLYIARDNEFQVQCSAVNVPLGSVLRACPYFLAPEETSNVVKRCAAHIKEDVLKGKSSVEHVVQAVHEGATYQRCRDTGRLCVVLPYQHSPGSSTQGCAEPSCYKFKLMCMSSCYGIQNKPLSIRFTLENNGLILGSQMLEVKVCEYPKKESNMETPECSNATCKESRCATRIVEDFIVPALDAQTYGDMMFWDENIRGAFLVKWTHKAKNSWSTDEVAVFRDWDRFKGRPDPVGNKELVESKQRFRAAMRNQRTINEIRCDLEGYRKYAITNFKQIKRTFQENVDNIPTPQLPESVKKSRLPASAKMPELYDSGQSNEAEDSSRTQQPRMAKTTKAAKAERPPRLVKFDVPMYEELGEDDDPEYKSSENPKKRKLPPSKATKKKKVAAPVPPMNPFPLLKKYLNLDSVPTPVERKVPSSKSKAAFSKSAKRKIPVSKLKKSVAKSGSKTVAPSPEPEEDDSFPKVRLVKLTAEDVLQARVKNEADILQKMEHFVEKKTVPRSKSSKNKSTSRCKSSSKRKSSLKSKSRSKSKSSSKQKPSSKQKTLSKAMSSPKLQNVMDVQPKTEPKPTPVVRKASATEIMKFEATPLCASSIQSPPPAFAPSPSLQATKIEMPKDFENIKTQSDMILALIKAALPNLPNEKVSAIYEYLVEMGVETADDLAFIDEEDLNKIVKPIQSRKLIAAWKNKGVSGSILPKRTCQTEPVTFVPAVFQINNMPSQSQNQSNSNRQVFSESEASQQNTVMQSINIPGWSQKVYPESGFGNYQGASLSTSQKVHPESSYALSRRQDGISGSEWSRGTGLSASQSMHPESSYAIPTRQDTNWGQSTGLAALQKMLPESNYVVSARQDTNSSNAWSQGTNLSAFQKVHPESNYVVSTRQDSNSCDAWSQGTNLSALQKMHPELSYSLSSRQDANTWNQRKTDLPLPQKVYSKQSCSNSVNEWSQSSDTSVAQVVYPESNYAMVPLSKNANSSGKSEDFSESIWAHKFLIPWHKIPAATMNFLLNKLRVNHRHRQIMIRIICNEIFEVTSDPTQKDLEIICKKAYEQFPESLCDSRGGQTYIDEYSNFLKLLRNRVEMMKMESKVNGNGEPDPSLSVAENQRRWMSESYGNDSNSDLQLCIEASGAKSPNLQPSSSVSSTAASDGVLEDFQIPWPKMSCSILNALIRKDKLTKEDRRQIVYITCDELFKQRKEAHGMEIIARKIYDRFPSFRCVGIRDVKHLSKIITNRMKYLKDKLRTGGKRKPRWQMSEVSSSQPAIDPQLSSDTPDCVSSRGASPSSPPLENIYNPSQSMEFISSSVPSFSLQDSTIPSPWAVSFQIPWFKMPESLIKCLRNKERLIPTQKMDLVSQICEEILQTDPNPERKNIRFIAERASEEYPESLCDIVDGEPVGFSTLADQLWLRIENSTENLSTGSLKRKQGTYETYGILEGELKKAKLEPEQSYEAEDLIRQFNSS